MFTTRTISLLTDTQKQLAIAAIQNAPTGQNLEVVIREVKKQRSLDANAAYWAALNDIASQAWMGGKQYSADIWHIYCRQQFMPDEAEEPYIFDHVLDREVGSYHKWAYLPNGERQCIASTTQLTKHGFSEYITHVLAFGGSLGVLFTTKER
jgi:hypothetical protein